MSEQDETRPRLFVVYLGGDPAPGRIGEDHEVVTVVANDLKSARSRARAKWTGSTKAHVDMVQELRVVDGHEIVLEATDAPDESVIDGTYVP